MKPDELLSYAELTDKDPDIFPDWIIKTIDDKETRNLFMLEAYNEEAKGGNVRSLVNRLRQDFGYETTPIEICVLMCIITRLDTSENPDINEEEHMFIRRFCEVEIED